MPERGSVAFEEPLIYSRGATFGDRITTRPGRHESFAQQERFSLALPAF